MRTQTDLCVAMKLYVSGPPRPPALSLDGDFLLDNCRNKSKNPKNDGNSHRPEYKFNKNQYRTKNGVSMYKYIPECDTALLFAIAI